MPFEAARPGSRRGHCRGQPQRQGGGLRPATHLALVIVELRSPLNVLVSDHLRRRCDFSTRARPYELLIGSRIWFGWIVELVIGWPSQLMTFPNLDPRRQRGTAMKFRRRAVWGYVGNGFAHRRGMMWMSITFVIDSVDRVCD